MSQGREQTMGVQEEGVASERRTEQGKGVRNRSCTKRVVALIDALNDSD
jgi:hypothetical protein